MLRSHKCPQKLRRYYSAGKANYFALYLILYAWYAETYGNSSSRSSSSRNNNNNNRRRSKSNSSSKYQHVIHNILYHWTSYCNLEDLTHGFTDMHRLPILWPFKFKKSEQKRSYFSYHFLDLYLIANKAITFHYFCLQLRFCSGARISHLYESAL